MLSLSGERNLRDIQNIIKGGNKMKTMTVKEFKRLRPCYPDSWIKTIVGNKEVWNALEVLKLDNVPAEDRLWAVIRQQFLDDKTLRLFAVWCARQIEYLMNDVRSLDAIDVAERYANGKATDKELNTASNNAWSAAKDAIDNEYWDGARLAAHTLDFNISWYSSYSIVFLWTDNTYKAYEKALDREVSHLIKMIEENEL